MFPSRKGSVNFVPDRDIPPLDGKVAFITGGTAGIGRTSVEAIAKHRPAHIYFSGRNRKAGESLVASIDAAAAGRITFVEMDLASLASVKTAVAECFHHDRLDVLICNAGIMAHPPSLSKDGYEVQFATNHLGHAGLIRELMPTLLTTAKAPGSDVRIAIVSSVGHLLHPRDGISLSSLNTTQAGLQGQWIRYGQSKLANILYASELARRYPQITTVSLHPGIVNTELVTSQSWLVRALVYLPNWLMGVPILSADEGSHNQLWTAVGAGKKDLVNGAFYLPVGILGNDTLDPLARDDRLARKLWDWTEEALSETLSVDHGA